jgi:hypothetical protein
MFGKSLKKPNIIGTAKGIIYNKYVLYVVFLAALVDLLYSAVREDYTYCILFVLVGFLVAFFNKNMTVILTLTIAVSTILRNLIRGNEVKVEGFDSEEPDKLAGTTPKKKTTKKEEVETTDEEKPGSNATETPKKTQTALMNSLKNQALDLQEAQQNIIKGFEEIEPYMNQAESLIDSIQNTALTIQDMRNNKK